MRVFYIIAFFLIAELMVSAQTSLCAPPGGYDQARTIFKAASESKDQVALSQAQNDSAAQSSDAVDMDDPTSMFSHSDSRPFWISGQTNIIFQAHPPFHAAYSGANSLSNVGE
jgi:hypothetical protein